MLEHYFPQSILPVARMSAPPYNLPFISILLLLQSCLHQGEQTWQWFPWAATSDQTCLVDHIEWSYYIGLNFVTIQCSLNWRVLLTRSAHTLLSGKRGRKEPPPQWFWISMLSRLLCLPSLPSPNIYHQSVAHFLWKPALGISVRHKNATSGKCTLLEGFWRSAALLTSVTSQWTGEWHLSSHFSSGTIRIGANKALL